MARDKFAEFERAGGPIPTVGVMGESFAAGYIGQKGARMGVPTSNQRRMWQAGRRRAKVEPGLNVRVPGARQ